MGRLQETRKVVNIADVVNEVQQNANLLILAQQKYIKLKETYLSHFHFDNRSFKPQQLIRSDGTST